MQEYFLKSYIETRAVEIANYIVENNATVRQAAKQFGISKSTVHKDITDADRLLRIDPELAAKARRFWGGKQVSAPRGSPDFQR